jgi:hypothetical protein
MPKSTAPNITKCSKGSCNQLGSEALFREVDVLLKVEVGNGVDMIFWCWQRGRARLSGTRGPES